VAEGSALSGVEEDETFAVSCVAEVAAAVEAVLVLTEVSSPITSLRFLPSFLKRLLGDVFISLSFNSFLLSLALSSLLVLSAAACNVTQFLLPSL